VRRVLRIGLAGASALLLTNALFGENGYLAGVRAQREHDALARSIARLRVENQALLDETRRLEDDAGTLEEVARREHNLTRPGEVLVIIRDARPAAPPK
jgi:cell division protein FtsB